MNRVLNFGSLNIDYVYSLEYFVRAGETVISDCREIFVGGKGLNQSVALGSAGAKVYHAGAVGTEDGQMLVDTLLSHGVNADFVERVNIPSGHTVIQLEKSGKNSIILFPGANHTITDEQIECVLSEFSAGDFVVLQNEINGVGKIIDLAKDKGMSVVLNPSPMNGDILSLPLDKVDYLILNEIEATDILGVPFDKNLDELLIKRFPHSKIVLTLGENGSVYRDSDTRIQQGIYKVPVVDTTGAGDTFTGFFIGTVSQGRDVKTALELAAKAAAISVTVKGAANSVPTLEKVEEFAF